MYNYIAIKNFIASRAIRCKRNRAGQVMQPGVVNPACTANGAVDYKIILIHGYHRYTRVYCLIKKKITIQRSRVYIAREHVEPEELAHRNANND